MSTRWCDEHKVNDCGRHATPAIAPCWWCGNPYTHVEGAVTVQYVACFDGNCCYARSPEAESEDAAIRVHNAGPRGGGK